MIEKYRFDQDITTLCVTAESFPEGVLAAHQKLHTLVEYSPTRKYFGISYPIGPGKILYQAATEMAPDEDADALDCDVFFIKKGEYLSVLLRNFREDIPGIGRTFQLLLQDPGIDPNGYCLEWYLNEQDVQCMVRLADKEQV
jgi:hypothetical protein